MTKPEHPVVEALEYLQYSASNIDDEYSCPECGALRNKPHKDFCDVGKAIPLARSMSDELAQAQRENMCDACAGTGKPISGLSCQCGGSGKMSDAAVYLRDELIKAQEQLWEAQREIKNLAPTGKYNGLDIEGWYQRAEAAETKNRELAAQVAVMRNALELSKRQLLSVGYYHQIASTVENALANLPAEAEKLMRSKENE